MLPPPLASRIAAVTVSTHGAIVTRQADLSGISGRPERIRLSGLPLCLEDASLRVTIAGGAAFVSDVQVALDVPPVDAALPPPQDAELRSARLAVAAGEARIAVLEAQLNALAGSTIQPRPAPQRGAPPATSPTAARLALVGFISARSARLHGDLAGAQAAQVALAERLAGLEARAAAATSARQARSEELRKSAVVSLRWAGDVTASGALQVEYRVPGARWMPSYVLRFDAGMRQASLQMRAAVAQASGEDWDGVRLTLSTAHGLAWHELAELASRRIGRAKERPAARGWRNAPEGAEALYADYDRERARRAPVPPAEPDQSPPRVGRTRGAPAPVKSALPKPAAPPHEDVDMMMVQRDDVPEMSAMAAIPAPAPMAMASRAARPDREERKSKKMREVAEEADEASFGEGTVGGGGPGGPPAAADAAKTAADPSAWLAFGDLRLGGPDDGNRGRLRPVRSDDGYLVLLAAQGVVLPVPVAGVLREANRRAGAPQQLPAPGAYAQAPQEAHFAHAYPADLPVTLASDGGWHVVPVTEQAVAIATSHICVPREAREVFRSARFANALGAPLPAGPIDCYAGERYLMTVPLAGVDRGGEVTIGLGVEPGLAVARNTSVAERSGGLLGGTLNVDHRIRIRIANKLQVPAEIEVRERLPVARSEECAVKVGAVAPAWAPFAQPEAPLDGGHRWQVTIAPAAEVELAADYTVTFPAKHEIVGGNRREGG